MTDPTTRYPLPDDPGVDPLGTPAPSPTTDVDAPAADGRTAVTSTATVGAPPPPPPTAVEASSSPPPPPAAAWTPSPRGEHRWPPVIFGLILLGIGLWFFAEVTLGIDLPTIRWGQLWPLILIVIGVLVLYGSRLGRSR
jgi:hypothetical protein